MPLCHSQPRETKPSFDRHENRDSNLNASLLRPALYIAALCGLYLAAAMFLPAMVDPYYGHRDWQVFALSGFMVGGISLMTALATRGPPPTFNKRLGFLLVNLPWGAFPRVAAITHYIAEYAMSFSKPLFQMDSGTPAAVSHRSSRLRPQ